MIYRIKTSFIIFIGIVMFAILASLERKIFFTHGFNTSTTTIVRRTVSSNNLATMPRTKASLHIPLPITARSTKTILTPYSSLIVSATRNSYGKGVDISPECNKNEIKISDSFPNGIIPKSVTVTIEQNGKDLIEGAENSDGRSSKVPIGIAFALLFTGMVRPMDVALVVSWAAYFTILNMTARSARDDGAPILPAVPMQSHIPVILSNPLGKRFERSSTYRMWLKLGALLGVIGPSAWLLLRAVLRPLQGAANIEIEALQAIARPLFLMCCQVVTEAISKKNLIPLPIRILIPLGYNSSRLVYLWHWAFDTTNQLDIIGRGLGIINIVYWAINLFAFLIPIASTRYMRAHYFGVEAEEVTTRLGMEEMLGLLPNNI